MPEALGQNVRDAVEKFVVLSPFGELLGLVVEGVEADRVTVRLPFRSQVTTLGEMVHGGAIASLVDVAATAAAWATPGATLGARGSTVGFSISYLAPGLGCDLVAQARIVQRGKTLCVVEVDVHDPQQVLVSRALVTYRLSLAKSEAAE